MIIIDYILEIIKNILGINKPFDKEAHRRYAEKRKKELEDITSGKITTRGSR
jgi:hypothetical protein